MLDLIHIPRTGCYARQEALKPYMHTSVAHQRRVSDVAPEDTPVVFVRDPIDRYLSVWNHLWRNRGPSFMRQWETADEMARDIEHAHTIWETQDQNLYRAQTWWIDDDRDDLLVGRFWCMDEDMLRIFGGVGYVGVMPRTNHTDHHAEALSVGAIRRLRLWYAEDYAFIEGIR